MSNKERWLSSAALLMAILPFILVASSLQLLPDRIVLPTVNGEELMLSKYQYLFIGLFGGIPAVLMVVARILRARRLVERNFTFMCIAALCVGGVFLLVSVYGVLYHIRMYDIDLIKRFDFFGGAAVIASLLGGMLSTYFPQLRRNDVFGLKNKYTMSDTRIWTKVHHVAADVYLGAFYAFAVFSSMLSIWLEFRYGWVHLILWVCVATGLIIWGRVYSYSLSKRLGNARDKIDTVSVEE